MKGEDLFNSLLNKSKRAMNIPESIRFTKSHEWILQEGETAKIGLSDFAQSELGDIVFIELPEIGTEVTMEEPFAEIESVKSASEIYSPVSGVILSINQNVADSPEKINENPYESWLVEVESITALTGLMTFNEYQKHCESES